VASQESSTVELVSARRAQCRRISDVVQEGRGRKHEPFGGRQGFTDLGCELGNALDMKPAGTVLAKQAL
jgi:hypothetical protein